MSVVIPFRDRIEWTEAAVKSVLNQTFQDFEVILVDDGSSEDHHAKLGSLDPRIVYLRQSPKGPSAARNAGIRVARGAYIAFLDSDDLFAPTKLEMQVALMRQKPEMAFSHTSYRRVNVQGEPLQVIHSGTFTGRVYPGIYSECPVATPTVMVRREILDGVSFCETLNIAEDVILWIAISRRTDFLGIDVPLTDVRIHGKNAILDTSARIQALMNIFDHAFKLDDQLGLLSRRLIKSDIYARLAHLHGRQNQPKASVRYFWWSLISFPLNIRIFTEAAKLIVPLAVQERIRRLWKARIEP